MPQEYRLILKHADQPGYTPDMECYLRHGGYDALKKVLALAPKDLPDGKKLSPQEQVREDVKASGLRGRGGAGFSAGIKWSLVDRKSGKPIYLICNADESEPGTFKDRQIIHKDPHQLIEGMILSCWANDVKLAYLYIRGEMAVAQERVATALNEAYKAGYVGKNILGSKFSVDIVLHWGAGAYVVGEETALIESLEGNRGMPRLKPPFFPAAIGLYGQPTIVNNVETLANLPWLMVNGAEAYTAIGTKTSPGTRMVAVSGHVKRPGVYEIVNGTTTFRDLLYGEDFCGGIRNGNALKAFVPGGGSAPWFTPDQLDLPFEASQIGPAGSMLGSGAVMVMDETTDMVKVALRIMRFYNHESCGWCIPCREGTTWLRKMLARIVDGNGAPRDVDLIGDLASSMLGRTFCPLGDAAALPTISLVKKWRPEFEAYVAKNPFASTELVQVA